MKAVPRTAMFWEDFVYALREHASRWPWYIDADGCIRARDTDGEELSPLEAVCLAKYDDRFHLGDWLGAAARLNLGDELGATIIEAADLFAGYDLNIRVELLASVGLKDRYDRLPHKALSGAVAERLRGGIPDGRYRLSHPTQPPIFEPKPPLTRYGEMAVYYRSGRSWKRLGCACGSKLFSAIQDGPDDDGQAVLACIAGHENRIALGFRAKPADG